MLNTSEEIANFGELVNLLLKRNIKKRIAVVWPEEAHTQEAVKLAVEKGFIDPIFVCSQAVADKYTNNKLFTCLVATDPTDAAKKAVALVRSGEAETIMKGFVSTDVLLRAILDKEVGILPRGTVMTHITVAEIPSYKKLLVFTDPAVIPFPTDEQREAQIKYVVDICHKFQIKTPKVSLIHCSEKVDERHFPYTAHYLTLKEKCKNGELGDCIIDGPLDLKTSCSLEALQYKQIESPINGEADALIMPNIEAGNAFYKTITLFCQAETAAVLQGPLAPIILTSRGDSITTKLNSLALATLISDKNGL